MQTKTNQIQKNFEVEVNILPECDFCQDHEKASYDCKIPGHACWGNVCEKHFVHWGCSLGLGKGKKLIVA